MIYIQKSSNQHNGSFRFVTINLCSWNENSI